METFMSAVWAALQSFSLGLLLVSVVAANVAVIIYYYVNQDDEEETTGNTEDTTGPVVFSETDTEPQDWRELYKSIIRDDDNQRHALLRVILPRQHRDLIGRFLGYKPPV
ncbi:hypothetical protein Q7C36_015327 [Tachysurus vachellii]|uniref:Uncharacterized protein n=1 Tax=Tachysurus vachellii TaxID=175792 RepID=A0AA88MBW0_TACVA|nr:hypothetical protein Q7C36_015327 [Tachysurus vachellii]